MVLSLLLVHRQSGFKPKFYWWLVKLGLAYGILHFAVHLYNRGTSTAIAALATTYNGRIIAYAIIGYSAALLNPGSVSRQNMIKILLITSSFVCLFGLIQFAGPRDLMTHFGYSVERGVRPNFFIDDKPDLPRIMSTLRDPNSLAAYLSVPIVFLWLGFLKYFRSIWRWRILGLLVLHLVALTLTFSRAGWGGTIVSLVLASYYFQRSQVKAWLKLYWIPLAVVFGIFVSGLFIMRDQYFIQHVIFHSDESTVAEQDSNELHASFVRRGISGVAEKPLGHGPGRAGIVSIHAGSDGLLTENYFVQIAYEVGLVGLAIFGLIWYKVWRKIPKTTLFGLTIWATAAGFVLMAMVSHLWTNEAVATIWWLPSGYKLAQTNHKHWR